MKKGRGSIGFGPATNKITCYILLNNLQLISRPHRYYLRSNVQLPTLLISSPPYLPCGMNYWGLASVDITGIMRMVEFGELDAYLAKLEILELYNPGVIKSLYQFLRFVKQCM